MSRIVTIDGCGLSKSRPSVVRATLSSVDLDKKTKHQYVRTFFIRDDTAAVDSVLAPDASEIVASQISPTGKLLAVLREIADSSSPGQKKRLVEVWSGDRLVASEDVTSRHEGFYADGGIILSSCGFLVLTLCHIEYLSSISFSPSENKLVYTAEAKAPEFADDESLLKYRFTPPLGESYGEKKRPTIFLFDWGTSENGSTSVVQLGLEQDPSAPVAFGNPVFASENKLLAVGFEHEKNGRLLGIIYCPSRRAGIWELSLPSIEASDNILHCTITKVTPANRSCRSPRVFHRSTGASLVVYVSNAPGGPHASCVTLNVRDLDSGNERVLVDPVWDPKHSKFPGLYTTTLPAYPFLEVSGMPYIVLTSTWRSRSTAILVSLHDGSWTDLSPNDDGLFYTWTVLGTDGNDQIICTRSAPARPSELVLGKLAANEQVQWRVVAQPDLGEDRERDSSSHLQRKLACSCAQTLLTVKQRLAKLTTSVLPVPDRFPLETIVVRGENDASAPCITQVHGGPHSVSLSMFSAFVAAFALEGCRCIALSVFNPPY